MDAKIVDVKRALEAKGIQIESIYEMYKEGKEPEKVVAKAGAPAPPKGPPPSGAGGPAAKDPSVKGAAEPDQPARTDSSAPGPGSPPPSPASSTQAK